MRKPSARTKQAARIIKSDLNHIKNTIQDAAWDVSRDMRKRRAYFQNQMAGRISHQPFKSVIFAALSGAIVGFVMRGRKNHH